MAIQDAFSRSDHVKDNIWKADDPGAPVGLMIRRVSGISANGDN